MPIFTTNLLQIWAYSLHNPDMKRDLEEKLLSFLNKKDKHKNVLIVEGARQVGKSYLIKEALSKLSVEVLQFNLEESPIFRNQIDATKSFAEFSSFMQSEYDFKENKSLVLFIDEAQESKQLGSYVRFMKEKWQNKSVILSGSSMTRLFEESRVPVGRVDYLRLYPLSFNEFLRAIEKENYLDSSYSGNYSTNSDLIHEQLLKMYDAYLSVGGLPEVVLSYARGEKKDVQDTIRKQIYFSQQDDFNRKETSLKNHLFEDAMKAVANTIGYPLSLNRISNNYRDAKSALSIMESWHLILSCKQLSFSQTSNNFHPKCYLYDIGLTKQLRETVLPPLSLVDTVSPVLRTSLGGLIENAIYLNLLSGTGFLQDISGWRQGVKSQQEIDFVMRFEDRSIPIEVKASIRTHQAHCKSLLKYLEESSETLGILISAAPFAVKKEAGKTIILLPVYYASRQAIENLVHKYA